MHSGNHQWLQTVKVRYPEHFKGAQVLEIGAYNVNGTARDHFKECKRYVGVDQTPGPCVDIAVDATATVFKPGEFDTLLYLSVFEHDPKWWNGFSHNLQWVRDGGLIIVCWGAEGNLRHAPEPWAIVHVKDFMNELRYWPIVLEDAFFEAMRHTDDAKGCFDVVARKKNSIGVVKKT